MIIRSADSQGLLLHTPPPMLSGIPTPTHTISYAVQNYQTLERFLESLYLLAAVPVSFYMIISLSFFSNYHVVFVFLRLLFFLVHTYWLYLSASISLSLPFFLAFTWHSLTLRRHPRNPRRPPRNRRNPPLP